MKEAFYIFCILWAVLSLLYFATPSATLFHFAISLERKIAGLTLKQICIQEGEISYLEGGKGETLIFLHGFGANKDNWNRIAKHLTNQYHVIAIDLPGFGDSFRNIELDHDVSPQVKRLDELIEVLNLTSFHIAGNSMGGYIAGNYAATYPEKIVSLWLINPLGVASSKQSEMFDLIGKQHRPMVLARDKIEYSDLISFVFHQPPLTVKFFVDVLAKQAHRDFLLHEKIFQDIHHLSNFRVNFSEPLDIKLTNFKKPVLVTWGRQDRVLHSQGAEQLWLVVPQAKTKLMESIGHLPMIEAPKVTANQFKSFIKNLSRQ